MALWRNIASKTQLCSGLWRFGTAVATTRNSSSSGSHLLHCLPRDDRQLLQLRGREVAPFLQGLITNDMQHLLDGAPSMYAMILNSQGRVLHDIILYNKSEGDMQEFLIEVQDISIEQLEKHLKMFRLRKKIDINICSNMKCWVVFDPEIDFNVISNVDIESLYMNPKVDSKHELSLSDSIEGMVITRDPRMKYLGHKIVLPSTLNATSLIPNLTASSNEHYRRLRYRLGVAEGAAEIPHGNVMPLEANIDYLHGISFHKGCYVGQELTARTFHTGVVRKRYMPLLITGDTECAIPNETTVLNSKGKSVGRVRAHSGSYGVGLLRIADCLSETAALTVEGCPVSTFRPAWWPIEAAKQAQTTSTSPDSA